MGAIGVIAFNAFRESLRDKILYNLVLFAGLPSGSRYCLDLTITEHHKMIADMGLTAISPIGVIIAMTSSASVWSTRKSNGTRSIQLWPDPLAVRFSSLENTVGWC